METFGQRVPGEPLCPSCGFRNDGTVATDGSTGLPKDGDASICLNCGEPARFHVTAFGMGLRRLDEEELAEFEREFGRELKAARGASAAFHRQHGTRP